MIRRGILVAVAAVLCATAAPSTARAYIHFPPMTLPKMCKNSAVIRVLKVEKFDKEKGVILFETAEYLKKEGPPIPKVKHVLAADTAGMKPLLDWLAAGKAAVMFTIERKGGASEMGCGFVFIDEFAYSVDYNPKGEYWIVMRAEPEMTAFFHGKVETLREAVKDTLAGKEVKVPTKEAKAKADGKERQDAITEAMQKNRK